jgi:hypothetical protein
LFCFRGLEFSNRAQQNKTVYGGTRQLRLLGRFATSLKVTGSNPDEVIEIFSARKVDNLTAICEPIV